MRGLRCFAVTVAIVALYQTAFAFPPAGIAVPSPEALPAGSYDLQLDYHGQAVLQAPEARLTLGLQLGLGHGVEIGVDTRLGGARDNWPNHPYRNWELRYDPDLSGFENTWFNFKKQVLTETPTRPALTWGVLNVCAEGELAHYIVTGKHFGKGQLVLGWSNAFEDELWFEQIGYQCNPDTNLLAEHISGGRFSTNFGVRRKLSENWFVTAAFMRANNSIYDHNALVRVEYVGNW